jgi:hypothetical protein
LGNISLRQQYSLPLSRLRTRRGILGSRTGQRCRSQVSEDSRPRRHCLELLDGSVSASGSGSRQCLAVENLAGADADAARVRALAAYKDFLALWKDADPDPDIPILNEAKAEYTKLQQPLLLPSISKISMQLNGSRASYLVGSINPNSTH